MFELKNKLKNKFSFKLKNKLNKNNKLNNKLNNKFNFTFSWLHSIHGRLRLISGVGVGVLLCVLGVMLSQLHQHQLQGFASDTLKSQLDFLSAKILINDDNELDIDEKFLIPAWRQPYSGHYVQINAIHPTPPLETSGVWRSRSLWDSTLTVPIDSIPDGQIHLHRVEGPMGQALILVERFMVLDEANRSFRLMVTLPRSELQKWEDQFHQNLLLYLTIAALLWLILVKIQAKWSLEPIAAIHTDLERIQQGKSHQLEGAYPLEIATLAKSLNLVLAQQHDLLVRTRTHVGNLAHALKTPLTILTQSSKNRPDDLEQIAKMNAHIQWHLRRAQLAGQWALAQGANPSTWHDMAETILPLLRTLERLYPHLDYQAHPPTPPIYTTLEPVDLTEMLGNILENASRYAQSQVHIAWQRVELSGQFWIQCTLQDDGVGLATATLERLRHQGLQRGYSLDEQAQSAIPSGSGLGLSIVMDILDLYDGEMMFLPSSSEAPLGASGLWVILRWRDSTYSG